MPYIGISVGTASVGGTISISFGTLTTVAATSLTVTAYNDNGTIQTTNSTTAVVITQRGVGSIVTSATTLTVASGVASTTFRGFVTGSLAILGKATGYTDGIKHVDVYAVSTGSSGGYFPSRPNQPTGGGAGAALLRDTIKINGQTLYRVILWDMESTKRGRNKIKAIIHDAKTIGVSSYLNDAGEIFFTLPYNHPQISEIKPLERHYRVDRFDEEEGQYRVISQGLIEDYEATQNEIIVYGIDYMGVLNKTITDPNTSTTYSYTSRTFQYIYQDQLTQAITAQANSRLGFIRFNAGTSWSHQLSKPLVINPSTNTYSVFTAGEPRMGFLSNLANIAMEGTTSKVVFGNTLESPTESYDTFFCDMNYLPTVNDDMVLEFGSNVRDFSYSPNYRSLRSRFLVVGTNNAASGVYTVWSSIATNSLTPTSLYGAIDEVMMVRDIKTTQALDARAAFQLYRSSPNYIRSFSLSVQDGSVIPFKRYKMGDDIRVRVKRGLVDIDANITLTGQRYTGNVDGSEQIFFEFILRGATSFDLYSPKPKPTSLANEIQRAGLTVPPEPVPEKGGKTHPPHNKTKGNTIKTGTEEPPAVKP
jgi:hypothetical protein